jgi:hypothetical protein
MTHGNSWVQREAACGVGKDTRERIKPRKTRDPVGHIMAKCGDDEDNDVPANYYLGSGCLYAVSKDKKRALILTCAHNFFNFRKKEDGTY